MILSGVATHASMKLTSIDVDGRCSPSFSLDEYFS
jgi:hypothetical protein